MIKQQIMKGFKDPEIKLFGMKIALPENGKTLAVSGGEADPTVGEAVVNPEDVDSDLNRSSMETTCLDDQKLSTVEGEEQEAAEDPQVEKTLDPKQQDLTPILVKNDSNDPETNPKSQEDPRTPSMEGEEQEEEEEEETATPETPKTAKDQTEPKTLKKPDKILPCPRCNSMDTKFCYYNNYNVNQPRHFCKGCQRYWTAGGTMRNVPVGAGRRKNKNMASHCRHITISEALQAARVDLPNGMHHPAFKTNGTVLSFGSDSRLCESMTSVLNMAEKKVPNGTRNGFYKNEQGGSAPRNGGENGDDCSSGSSVTTSNSMEDGTRNAVQEPITQSMSGLHTQMQCLPGVPWPYPWNGAVAMPAYCPPGYPMPFYPGPYWNCPVPGSWSLPWLSQPSPTITQKLPNSGPHSPTLGKHSREGDLLSPVNPERNESIQQKSSERSVLIPKTLRIDDPDEAAKSSIWTTLGIKNETFTRGGLFKGFHPKSSDKKNCVDETSQAMQANPAALSRSLSFQERF